mmetsp:Transcript_10109/g.33400  ORF Transcript_10109/g.33400 Transcript_10109/m.33400 type:complete len:269 (+) Transcript_10109:1469-2275(+)
MLATQSVAAAAAATSGIAPTPPTESPTVPRVARPSAGAADSRSVGPSGAFLEPLKRSRVLNVTRKPPAMFTAEMSTATAPSASVGDSGTTWPGSSSATPPSAVMPEMAFVTAMSGECSAGATPQTTCCPANEERQKTAKSEAASGESPDAAPAARTSAAAPRSSFGSSLVSAAGGLPPLALTIFAGGAATTAGGGGGGAAPWGGTYGGLGHVSLPSWMTSMARVAGSSKSTWKRPGAPVKGPTASRNLATLLPYSVEAAAARREGRSE